MADASAATPDSPKPVVFQLPPSDGDAPTAGAVARADSVWEEPLLQQHARWFCQLRWLVVGVLAVLGLAGLFSGPLSAWGVKLSPAWPLVTATVLAAVNGVFWALTACDATHAGALSARRQLWLQIVADLVILTAVIHYLGSLETCAPFMYLFHVILACIFFSPAESLTVSLLAIGLYVGALLLESKGLWPPQTILARPGMQERSLLTRDFLVLHATSVAATWSVIWYLASRLAETVRRHQRELAATNRKLAASSAERAQHMLQTTHQLKAPFAAIHANTQLLLGGYSGTLPPPAWLVVEKISTRCAALSLQIQEMLQLANLRSEGQVEPAREEVDLAALLDASLAHLEPSARQRAIRFQKELVPVTILAVPDHVRMLIDNVLVNAVNYSYQGGEVGVVCRPLGHAAAVVVIRDRGIGIPEAKLPRIFEDYYRTDEAARHNRASTGLGLAIVRHVARQMEVRIEVESAPHWGTRFSLTIPRAPSTAHERSRDKGS
jgi:signal transduction histidine kinase